jgi:hypothetical protein
MTLKIPDSIPFLYLSEKDLFRIGNADSGEVMPLNKLNLSLTEWQVQIVLEALQELEQKWRQVNETTADEDEQSEYANDLIQLNMTKEHILKAATKVLGPGIGNFSRQPI